MTTSTNDRLRTALDRLREECLHPGISVSAAGKEYLPCGWCPTCKGKLSALPALLRMVEFAGHRNGCPDENSRYYPSGRSPFACTCGYTAAVEELIRAVGGEKDA